MKFKTNWNLNTNGTPALFVWEGKAWNVKRSY